MLFLVTAGPTREPIDPVRYLSNRSSGKMGYAIAAAALARGHGVVLVTGPVAIPPPPGARVVSVETAREMHAAVAAEIAAADVAVFCAAVSDYRPAEAAAGKIKKDGAELVLRLVENPDILGDTRSVFGYGGVLVGFAAETGSMERHALDKLRRKGCDLIVANDVSRSDIAFDQDDNEVLVLDRAGGRAWLPRAPKAEIARALVARIETVAPG